MPGIMPGGAAGRSRGVPCPEDEARARARNRLEVDGDISVGTGFSSSYSVSMSDGGGTRRFRLRICMIDKPTSKPQIPEGHMKKSHIPGKVKAALAEVTTLKDGQRPTVDKVFP